MVNEYLYKSMQKSLNVLFTTCLFLFIVFCIIILIPAIAVNITFKEPEKVDFYSNINYINVQKDDFSTITKHKTIHSFYCKGGGLISHPFNMRLVELVREMEKIYGVDIEISSTFRTVAQNQLCGGVPNSNHLKGDAVDITMPESKLKHFFKNHEWIKEYITEFGYYNGFVHLAIDDKDYREFDNRKTENYNEK